MLVVVGMESGDRWNRVGVDRALAGLRLIVPQARSPATAAVGLLATSSKIQALLAIIGLDLRIHDMVPSERASASTSWRERRGRAEERTGWLCTIRPNIGSDLAGSIAAYSGYQAFRRHCLRSDLRLVVRAGRDRSGIGVPARRDLDPPRFSGFEELVEGARRRDGRVVFMLTLPFVLLHRAIAKLAPASGLWSQERFAGSVRKPDWAMSREV